MIIAPYVVIDESCVIIANNIKTNNQTMNNNGILIKKIFK